MQLERLRGEARGNGPEWLRSKLQDLSWKDVRESAQAAGLRVRKDGTRIWLSVGELRAALLEHLAPQRTVAPEEFGWFFSYVGLFFLSEKCGHIEGVLSWYLCRVRVMIRLLFH